MIVGVDETIHHFAVQCGVCNAQSQLRSLPYLAYFTAEVDGWDLHDYIFVKNGCIAENGWSVCPNCQAIGAAKAHSLHITGGRDDRPTTTYTD